MVVCWIQVINPVWVTCKCMSSFVWDGLVINFKLHISTLHKHLFPVYACLKSQLPVIFILPPVSIYVQSLRCLLTHFISRHLSLLSELLSTVLFHHVLNLISICLQSLNLSLSHNTSQFVLNRCPSAYLSFFKCFDPSLHLSMISVCPQYLLLCFFPTCICPHSPFPVCPQAQFVPSLCLPTLYPT